jgi:hypothetical protein
MCEAQHVKNTQKRAVGRHLICCSPFFSYLMMKLVAVALG